MQAGFSGGRIVIFLGLVSALWWMEAGLEASAAFLEGRAVVGPLVDGASWPCGGQGPV